MLDGYIVAYLNLDEVIRIIREEDEPKAGADRALQADRCAGRGDPQHAAPVLRKLEEIELRTEHKTLTEESEHLNALLGSDKKQWGEITKQIGEI